MNKKTLLLNFGDLCNKQANIPSVRPIQMNNKTMKQGAGCDSGGGGISTFTFLNFLGIVDFLKYLNLAINKDDNIHK